MSENVNLYTCTCWVTKSKRENYKINNKSSFYLKCLIQQWWQESKQEPQGDKQNNNSHHHKHLRINNQSTSLIFDETCFKTIMEKLRDFELCFFLHRSNGNHKDRCQHRNDRKIGRTDFSCWIRYHCIWSWNYTHKTNTESSSRREHFFHVEPYRIWTLTDSDFLNKKIEI